MTSRSFTAVATGALAARVDPAGGTTTGSPVVTDTAVTALDYGKPVTGAGIPAGTTIIGVVPGVSFTMSANATATASVAVTIGNVIDAGAGKTLGAFNIKVMSTAADCQVALETSPDNSTWTQMALVTGPKWGFAASSDRARYVRPNVVSLGTGAPPVAAVINANP